MNPQSRRIPIDLCRHSTFKLEAHRFQLPVLATHDDFPPKRDKRGKWKTQMKDKTDQ